MDDVHDYCNVAHWQDMVDPDRSQFNLAAREFRWRRPWLRNNLGKNDHFNYLYPTDGSVIFYGLRHAPKNKEKILFVANMEGAPRTIVPRELPLPNMVQTTWKIALATPGLPVSAANQQLTLHNSQGAVFVNV